MSPPQNEEPNHPDDRQNPAADFDRRFRSQLLRLGMPASSLALPSAVADWLMHLSCAPGRQMQLAHEIAGAPAEIARRVALRTQGSAAKFDRRFGDESWDSPFFGLIAESFLLTEEFSRSCFKDVPGLSRRSQRLLEFFADQALSAFTPTNFLATNPKTLEFTREERGANIWRGSAQLLADMVGANEDALGDFQVGVNLATAEGRVIFRNGLMEIIQYKAQTEEVFKEPVLLIPAWIMKYYVLDLSERNSLVRHLTSQGHTVFMVSWKNPGPEDRDTGFGDYLHDGALTAIEKVREAAGTKGLHLTGYCLGGTLAAIAAAWLGRSGDQDLASLTLLAAQVDFEDAGDLTIFIDESQISFLEDLMWQQGYLDSSQMSGSFQALKSYPLLWDRLAKDYLLGERSRPIDLMAWNADGTRLPFKMHSEYLRSCYLDNDLAEGRFEVNGEKISVSDIRAPIFAVGTTADHIAPWESVYKIRILSDTDVTFVLTKGGHNGGIVSPPGKPGKSFQMKSSGKDDHYESPEDWLEGAPTSEGSWWDAWTPWLAERSSGKRAAPDIQTLATDPQFESAEEAAGGMTEAPGLYVRRGFSSVEGSSPHEASMRGAS
ncbi:MAG: alpha/beta fold hydrolase [Pseudomonadota bacterium]